MTICPGSTLKSHPWGFVEKYLNLLDPGAEENRQLFDFIPRSMVKHRLKNNRRFFRYSVQIRLISFMVLK